MDNSTVGEYDLKHINQNKKNKERHVTPRNEFCLLLHQTPI